MNLKVPELLIILGIVLLLFGARKLPDLAASMGRSIREFRKASDDPDAEAAAAATGTAKATRDADS